MRARLGLAAIILIVLALDQASKLFVSANMGLGESIPVIPGLFHITLVRNSGDGVRSAVGPRPTL